MNLGLCLISAVFLSLVPFTPTILVEMYTNFVPLPDESASITQVTLRLAGEHDPAKGRLALFLDLPFQCLLLAVKLYCLCLARYRCNCKLAIVIESYGPAPKYYCEWIERLRHHDDPKKLWSRSTYSIATACPSCQWPHILTAVLPRHLLPMCYYKRGSHSHTFQLPTLNSSIYQWHVSEDLWWWHTVYLNFPRKILVTRPRNDCHVK